MPPITIYISRKENELIEKLKRFAQRESRSFSNVCLLAFKEFLEKHGEKIEDQKVLPFVKKGK